MSLSKTVTKTLDDEIPIEEIDLSDETYQIRRWDDPEVAGKKYLLGDVLGSGSSSTVREVLDMATLERKAVKIRKITKRVFEESENERTAKDIIREAFLLKKLRHENVLRVFDVFKDNESSKAVTFMTIMEYCDITLEELRVSKIYQRLEIELAHFFFKQLINSMEFLHSRGVVHKDIKLDNIMIKADGLLKIADFSCWEELNTFQSKDTIGGVNGSPFFQPPEMLKVDFTRDRRGFPVDIWAAGVTLYVIATGSVPFVENNATPHELLERILKAPFNSHSVLEANPGLKNLLLDILVVDVDKRLTIDGIKRQPWMQLDFMPVSVDIPPRGENGDKYRSMTMTPSLYQLHHANEEKVAVSDKDYDEFTLMKRTPLIRGNRTPSPSRRKSESFFSRVKRRINRLKRH